MPRPASVSRAERELVRSDRRWFLATVTVFAVSTAGLFALYGIYKVTGPHPEIAVLVRRVKGWARRILPRWRRLIADR
jgi:hypothetical protein